MTKGWTDSTVPDLDLMKESFKSSESPKPRMQNRRSKRVKREVRGLVHLANRAFSQHVSDCRGTRVVFAMSAQHIGHIDRMVHTKWGEFEQQLI